MDFARATAEQIDAVEQIVMQCREALMAQDILQWDAEYPNREFFQRTFAEGHLFVLTEGEVVLGGVVLDEWQAPEWAPIVWQERAGPNLVVHSLAVLPTAHGRGYGSALLGFCEAFARKEGYAALRLDAFSENKAALRFYERHGYRFCGAIQLPFKPVGHQEYYCYEKQLYREEGPAIR